MRHVAWQLRIELCYPDAECYQGLLEITFDAQGKATGVRLIVDIPTEVLKALA